MNTSDAIVFVIDDDESMRAALKSLIRSVGLSVETFARRMSFYKAGDRTFLRA